MRGLRKRESVEFERFFAIVQKEARSRNCVFFADAGDGIDVLLPGIEGEDMSGWLIPNNRADEFESQWETQTSSELDEWDDFFTFAEWKLEQGNLTITFNNHAVED